MFRNFLLVCVLGLLSACATKFPSPSNAEYVSSAEIKLDKGFSGDQIFEQTFEAHGGAKLAQLENLNVGLTGKWKQLIRRIQPLVTDYKYRVDSQERILPRGRIYASQYSGPAGEKSVFRSPSKVEVFYNATPSIEKEVLSSTALTADAFHLFLLGPLALEEWRGEFTRISNARFKGREYLRVHLQRTPGFGYSKSDQIVLWVDPQSKLTKLLQITLEGHSTTKGAHVEVEYLDYVNLDDYVFPVNFFERVNAPIAIDAHAWQLTGIDINRAYQIKDLQGPSFSGDAKAEASKQNLQSFRSD